MLAEALSALVPTRQSAVPRFYGSLENPNVPLHDPDAWNDAYSFGSKTDAGIVISHAGSLKYAPVWQAVSLISGSIALMTLNVYRRMANSDREIDAQHPAQFLSAEQPNEETSAFEFWRRIMVHALLWGNGYAFIQRRNRVGEPVAMVNLLPDRTHAKRLPNGKLYYVTEVDGQLEPLLREEVLHVKGLSLESGAGCDLVEKARNAWGLALAAEQFGSKYFANGAQAGGVLEIPVTFSEQAKAKLEEGWSRKYAGRENWFKTVVLRDGAKFHNVTIDPHQSEMSQLREDEVRDVARHFNMPGAKLGLSDSVSYNSVEQAQLQYIADTLNPWAKSVESECGVKLLSEQERRQRTHFFDHNQSKLIELDFKTLVDSFTTLRSGEIVNANEVRRKLNLPPRDDPGGDEYKNPNTTRGNSAGSGGGENGDNENEGSSTNDRQNRRRAAALQQSRDEIRSALTRSAERLLDESAKQAKSPKTFQAWVETGYKPRVAQVQLALSPSVKWWAFTTEAPASEVSEWVVGSFFDSLCGALWVLMDPPHIAADLEQNVARRRDEIKHSMIERALARLDSHLEQTHANQ